MVFEKILFLAYWAFFLALAWRKRASLHSYEDYVVAGRSQSAGMVSFSLLATAIGASALLGMTKSAESVGWPIFWWLGVGAIGLGLQAWLFTARVRDMQVNTLSQLVETLMGKPAGWFVALVVGVSWIGIVAAQFKAMGTVMGEFWPGVDGRILIAGSALAMTVYTLVGGQLSVMATDRWQLFLILVGVGLPLLLGIGDRRSYEQPFVLLNSAFGWKDLVIYLVLTGGAYLVGPDMFSRAFCARDGQTARRAVFRAAVGLVPLAVVITWVGIMAAHIAPGEGVPLLRLVAARAGSWGKWVVAFGILSALVSSADTTLLSSATIWNQDIIGRKSIVGIKVAIVVIGLLALVLALFQASLLQMLLNVYSLYVPAVVPVTAVALLAAGKRRLSRGWLMAGMIAGAIGGVLSLTGLGVWLKPQRLLAVYGALVALGCALIALVFTPQEKKR